MLRAGGQAGRSSRGGVRGGEGEGGDDRYLELGEPREAEDDGDVEVEELAIERQPA